MTVRGKNTQELIVKTEIIIFKKLFTKKMYVQLGGVMLEERISSSLQLSKLGDIRRLLHAFDYVIIIDYVISLD